MERLLHRLLVKWNSVTDSSPKKQNENTHEHRNLKDKAALDVLKN